MAQFPVVDTRSVFEIFEFVFVPPIRFHWWSQVNQNPFDIHKIYIYIQCCMYTCIRIFVTCKHP